MKTLLAIIGTLVVATFFYFLGVNRGWWRNIFDSNPPDDNLPDVCDPNRVGYRKDGVKDSTCGTVACNPDRLGYDMDGFPDPNCGFGRMADAPNIPKERILNRLEIEVRKLPLSQQNINSPQVRNLLIQNLGSEKKWWNRFCCKMNWECCWSGV